MRRLTLSLLLIIILAACSPAAQTGGTPTPFPFPTMTPGRVIYAVLPTVAALPLDGSGLSNPATVSALENRATPTLNYAACPAANPYAALPDAVPANASLLDGEIARFLSDGGTADALAAHVSDVWNALGEDGFIRRDTDLTGEGAGEVIVSAGSPEGDGTFMIFACADGRYLTRYSTSLGDEPPQIVTIADLNVNGVPEILFTSRACESANTCTYITQMATWNAESGRFVNLLGSTVDSEEAPTVEDIDGDRVGEVIIHMSNPGNTATGPLRTGYTVYDWDGIAYIQSVTQLNPPRFRIQVIHQADNAFAAASYDEAISLYQLALDGTGLDAWYNDETPALQSYILFRLLLAYALTGDERLQPTYEAIQTAYPDPAAAPVYAEMSVAFWNALQTTNDSRGACQPVQAIIAARAEAVDLLNRYGSRSPTYAAADLCPF